MSRGNAKLEVGQLVLTSSTPPGNLGLYAYDQDTIGVVGDLVCIDPKSKAESSVVTSTVDPVTGWIHNLVSGSRYPISDMFSSQAGATMPFSLGGIATGSYANHTFSLTSVFPFEWDAVQFSIVHGQNGTTGICQGMNIIAAVSDTMMADGIPVISGTGYNSMAVDTEPINPGFVQVTWGGKAAETVAPAIAAPGANRFSYGEWSDIIRIPSVSRVDGGVGHILTLRHYSSTATAVPISTPRNATPYQSWTEAEANTNGVPYAYTLALRKLATDGVGTPSNFVTASRDNGPATILCRFYSKGRRIPGVLWVGDSRFGTIAPSETSLTGNETLGNIVQSQLALTKPHAVLNYGASGWKTSQYQPAGKNVLSIARPKVAVYLVWSSNDGVSLNYDSTRIGTFKARALEFITECARNGCVPVLVGTFPSASALNGTQLTNAAECDAWVASLGVLYVLPMATLGVTSNWTWIGGNPGTNTADGAHPLQVGRVALATVFSSVISPLL